MGLEIPEQVELKMFCHNFCLNCHREWIEIEDLQCRGCKETNTTDSEEQPTNE